jgi:hypothetical protein
VSREQSHVIEAGDAFFAYWLRSIEGAILRRDGFTPQVDILVVASVEVCLRVFLCGSASEGDCRWWTHLSKRRRAVHAHVPYLLRFVSFYLKGCGGGWWPVSPYVIKPDQDA